MSQLNVGSNKIKKVYIGSTEIKKVYVGSTLIFSAIPPSPTIANNLTTYAAIKSAAEAAGVLTETIPIYTPDGTPHYYFNRTGASDYIFADIDVTEQVSGKKYEIYYEYIRPDGSNHYLDSKEEIDWICIDTSGNIYVKTYTSWWDQDRDGEFETIYKYSWSKSNGYVQIARYDG